MLNLPYKTRIRVEKQKVKKNCVIVLRSFRFRRPDSGIVECRTRKKGLQLALQMTSTRGGNGMKMVHEIGKKGIMNLNGKWRRRNRAPIWIMNCDSLKKRSERKVQSRLTYGIRNMKPGADETTLGKYANENLSARNYKLPFHHVWILNKLRCRGLKILA